MTDDTLTPERVWAALPFLRNVAESRARGERVEFGTGIDWLDSLDLHAGTLAALAEAWLANAKEVTTINDKTLEQTS